jgi:hypothetical protein
MQSLLGGSTPRPLAAWHPPLPLLLVPPVRLAGGTRGIAAATFQPPQLASPHLTSFPRPSHLVGRPPRLYGGGGEEESCLFERLITLRCPAIDDDLLDRLLPHVRMLQHVQACACGKAFVCMQPPEVCDTCLLAATREQLAATTPCAICRDEVHTAFAFKCPDCSCMLHQSCCFRMWSKVRCVHSLVKCPQCRRTMKRPAEVSYEAY